MGMYKGISPKRHLAYSNAPTVCHFDLGKMTRRMQQQFQQNSGCKPARCYYSAAGRKCFQGTRWLKSTGCWPHLDKSCILLINLVCNHSVSPFQGLTHAGLEAWNVNECFAPRAYPPRFGLRVVRLYQRFLASCTPCHPIPAELFHKPLQQLFAEIPWNAAADELWDDAYMYSVLAYLRGCFQLELGSWRPLFPKKL